jgi:CelD/BcsL family acetyltransferase involved in cellulose biosynthesis
VDLQVVTSEAGLLAARAEWDDLWQRAGGTYQASAEVALLSWRHVASAAGAELCCVLGRSAGALELVWPLVVTRRAGLRVLRPLGPGAADTTELLVTSDAVIESAFHGVLGAARADVVQLPYLPVGSALHRLGAGTGKVLASVPDALPVARLRGQSDWDAYRGSSNRKSMGKRLRRLERLGTVTRREIVGGSGSDELEPLMDWFLEHRLRRGEVTGRSGEWLTAPGYRDFLVAALRDTDPERPLSRVFVVELDGRPIALVTTGAGVEVAHTQVTAFDAAYAAHSPGLLAFEQAGRWAVGEQLDLNLGPGGETFKVAMARDHVVETASLTLTLTGRARLAWGARAGVRSLARRVRS